MTILTCAAFGLATGSAMFALLLADEIRGLRRDLRALEQQVSRNQAPN